MAGRERLALIALTVVAVLLRFPGLGNGLWLDEYYAFHDSFRVPFGEVFARYPGDNHHPLYAVLANASLRLFGDSPASARLPAMVFGAAGVPLLYLLGRRIATRTEAWLAACLLAVSYHHVWFSQNARGYTMLAFFTLLATLLLVRAIDAPSTGRWVAYALTAALGAYTHLTMVFIVVSHAVACAIVVALRRGRGAVPMALAFVGSGALTLLLYAPMLGDVIAYFSAPTDMVGISSPRWAIGEAVRVLRAGLGSDRGPALAAAGGVALVVGGGVMLGGVRSYVTQHLATALVLMLPAFGLVGGALLARGTMYPRFFFALAGPALLILVRGAVLVLQRPARARAGQLAPIGIAFIGLLVVASLVSLPSNYRLPKQDFEGALAYLDTAMAAGDQVVAVGGPTVRPFQEYHHRNWTYSSDLSDITRARATGPTWVVHTFPRYLDLGSPEIAEMLRRECTARHTFPGSVSGGDVVVCRLPATQR